MRAEITHKVPNGKMLRMTLEYDTATLQEARICGDFFVHPEETIVAMEEALVNLPVESVPSRVQEILDRVVQKNEAELIGIDTETLSKLIHEAIHQ